MLPRMTRALTIRPLTEGDVPAAQAISRLAFRTFLGIPERLFPDADFLGPRFRAFPEAAFAAWDGDTLVGSILGAQWGNVSVLGPLSVTPAQWNKDVAQRLIASLLEVFDEQWRVKMSMLYTFAQSPSHLGLFSRFGYWPHRLIAELSRDVPSSPAVPGALTVCRASELTNESRSRFFTEARALTSELVDGLDLTRAANVLFVPEPEQKMGDVVFARDHDGVLTWFALCHVGAHTEAGSGSCNVRFAALRKGADVHTHLPELVSGCEQLAAARGMRRVVVSVNLARRRVYALLRALGFRGSTSGVALFRPAALNWEDPDLTLLEDAR